ncbi:type II toxin-antitoxin system RelE family toxin [Photorhabdus temperata]|uniref:Plasmid stabilization protein n=1 Tax=Photorhabdus temperata J3 TaxID=1389415 RepID=U7QZB9_PHOTE|nr:hypothetical protein [Photorhabdus temperata]ERT11871.1 hypothetical protein O185_17290 [Photorhabdus temperata J3]
MPSKMSDNVTVQYTETAKTSVKVISEFLRSKEIDPRPIIQKLVKEFENKVCSFPEGSPISAKLMKLGCSKYRECNTSGGYRIIYSIDNGNQISAHVIMAQKQDIQHLLFTRLIEI